MLRQYVNFSGFQSLQVQFLVALFCIGIIPIMLASILLIQQERQALRVQATHELIGVAQALSANLENQLTGVLAEVRVMASLPAMTTMDPAQQKPLLRLLHQNNSHYDQIAISNLSGEMLTASTDVPAANMNHPTLFQPASSEQQKWVVTPNPSGTDLSLHIRTPIRGAEGQPVGNLDSVLLMPGLVAPLQALSESGQQAFVLDGSGALLIHAEAEGEGGSQSAAVWFALQPDVELANDTHIATTGAATNIATTGAANYEVAGTSWVAGYATVPDYAWTIVVKRLESEVLASTLATQRLALGALISSVLLGVVVAAAIATRLTKPVRNLADAARALDAGNERVPLPQNLSPESEVGALVQAFGKMRWSVIKREQALRHEINMRKNAEVQIRRHQSAMAASMDGMALLNGEHLIYANDALAQLYGYQYSEEIIGKSWLTFYSQQEQNRYKREAFPILRKQGMWRGEVVGQRKDGGEFFHEISIALTDTGDLVAVIHDLSERKLAEEMLYQTQKFESLGLLAGGVAHDFNNLLASIIGQISIALKKLPTEEPARQNIAKALTASERAADLTRQLLTYVGKGGIQKEILDLNQLITDSVKLVETTFLNRSGLELHLAPSLPTIKGDRGQLQQVIMNLLINAADAVEPTGGTIYIISTTFEHVQEKGSTPPQAARQKPSAAPYMSGSYMIGPYVVLEVADSGGGMEPQIMARIFDPFFTTKPHGHGLGLSSARGIIQQHQGHLQVNSQPGVGSTFRVMIPASTESIQPTELTLNLPVDMLDGTLLVIDDEEEVLETTREVLEMLGIQALIALNCNAGLKLFKEHRSQIKAIILDMKMPEIGGEETLRQLRMLDENIPIILSSGYTEAQVDQLLLLDAHLYFLRKPYTLEQFTQGVESVLTMHSAPAQPVHENPVALKQPSLGD